MIRLAPPPTSPDQLRRQSSVELAIAIALLSDRVDRLCEKIATVSTKPTAA
jgi:hypothetical protein